MQIPFSDKPITIYDLNIILSVGYRVKSSRGNQFRKYNKIYDITRKKKGLIQFRKPLLKSRTPLDTSQNKRKATHVGWL